MPTFTPPTVIRSSRDPLLRYSMEMGQSVVRIDGAFQTIAYPWLGELTGAEGTDWFLGGRTYNISFATAAELTAAGYDTDAGTTGFGHGPFGHGPFGGS